MNWDAIGSVGEALGAAGVIASLLYLAAQVRGGRRASAVEAKLTSTRLLSDFTDELISSPELNALFMRGRADLFDLSNEEYIRYSNMSLKAFWFFSAGYFQYRMETLEASDWYEVRAVIHYWISGAGCRAWWEKMGRNMFGPEFVEFLDAEIANLDANK